MVYYLKATMPWFDELPIQDRCAIRAHYRRLRGIMYFNDPRRHRAFWQYDNPMSYGLTRDEAKQVIHTYWSELAWYDYLLSK